MLRRTSHLLLWLPVLVVVLTGCGPSARDALAVDGHARPSPAAGDGRITGNVAATTRPPLTADPLFAEAPLDVSHRQLPR